MKRSISLLLFLCISPFFSGCIAQKNTDNQYAGHLTISGSTALEPFVTVAARIFMQEHPDAHINVTGGGSTTGLQNVTRGTSTIGDSDIYADPALYPDPDLTDHIICVTPFIMIVHPGVSIQSLTNQQISAIFLAQIRQLH